MLTPKQQSFKHAATLLNASPKDARFEIRVIRKGAKPETRHFDRNDFSDAVRWAYQWDNIHNIYITINPACKVSSWGISDCDISKILWLPLDFDPIRATNTASTDEELKQAKATAKYVFALLGLKRENCFAQMSGNGIFGLARIVPEDRTPELKSKLTRLYQWIAGEVEQAFPAVSFDLSVRNPSRIMKLAGTMSVKGEDTEKRPHRRAEIMVCPETFVPVPLADILAKIPADYRTPEEKRRDEARIRAEERLSSPRITGEGFRTYPESPLCSSNRIGVHGPCACCGDASPLCCEGTTAEGHSWGACWRTESWSRLGEEGHDFNVYGDSGNETAMFWLDRWPWIPRKEDFQSLNNLVCESGEQSEYLLCDNYDLEATLNELTGENE